MVIQGPENNRSPIALTNHLTGSINIINMKDIYHYDILFNADARNNFEWVKDLCSTITIEEVLEVYNKQIN